MRKNIRERIENPSTTAKKLEKHINRAKKAAKVHKARRRSIARIEPTAPRSMYSEILADRICEHIANGISLKKICEEVGYPTAATVQAWVNYPDEINRPGFQDRFLKARELGYHLMADEIIQISDDSAKDKVKRWVRGKEIEVVDLEHIQRDRLRIQTRQFILSKALPKIYGDNIKIEHNVNINLIERMAAARARIQSQPQIIEAEAEEV